MKILIKVTKDVLRRSAMCGPNPSINCAVAVSVKQLFPNAAMGTSTLCIDGDRTIIIIVPEYVSEFINRFDRSTPSERINLPEFSFEIEVPSSVIDKIGIQEAYRILSESKTLELVHP